jgi:hypothetical protein
MLNIEGICALNSRAASQSFVYDVTGKTIKRSVANGSLPYLGRDFGMARGVYIFKPGD